MYDFFYRRPQNKSFTRGLYSYAVVRYATADYSMHFRLSQPFDDSRQPEAKWSLQAAVET